MLTVSGCTFAPAEKINAIESISPIVVLLQDVDARVQQELDSGVAQCLEDIQVALSPVETLATSALEGLNDALERLQGLRSDLEELKQQAANVE